MRPTYAEVDLGAIRHNVAAFRDLVAPAELCVVVKADAYGHGDAPVAEAAMEAGASCLAVALLEEGIRLREAEVETPIIILSEPDPRDAIEVAKWGLTPTVYSHRFVDALAETGTDLDVHVKVDTGMHRVGIAPSLLPDLMREIEAHPNLGVAALWSHFPVADEDPEFTNRQIERFEEIVDGYDVPMVHLAKYRRGGALPEGSPFTGPGRPRHIRAASKRRDPERHRPDAGDADRQPRLPHPAAPGGGAPQLRADSATGA